MKNTSVTCIFLEPPGNIQKELHETRLLCAQKAGSATLLVFPELIPLIVYSNVQKIKLAALEEKVRGKVQILMKLEQYCGWSFLPVILQPEAKRIDACSWTAALPFYNNAHEEVLLPPSWHTGMIAMGALHVSLLTEDVFLGKPALSFMAGALIEADIYFENAEGTEYSIVIKNRMYRRKPKIS